MLCSDAEAAVMTARTVGWGVLLGTAVVPPSGCQPGLRVGGQAAAPGAGLGESPCRLSGARRTAAAAGAVRAKNRNTGGAPV